MKLSNSPASTSATTRKKLKQYVSAKFRTDEQKAEWWAKFAAVRRRRVWKLSEQQNHHCCYCGTVTWVFDGFKSADQFFYPDRYKGMSKQRMATADHLVPASQHGSEHISNFVMACYRCNHLRGDMDAVEFWEVMQDPEKIKELIWYRRKGKRTRSKERYIKRQSHRNRFAFWLGYLLCVSPVACVIVQNIMHEIGTLEGDPCEEAFYVGDILPS